MKNSLTKRKVFDVFEDDWFNKPFRGLTPWGLDNVWENYPKTNLVEKDDHYELSLDVPGFSKEEIDIVIDNGIVSVFANHEENNDKEEDGKKVLVERKSSSLSRSFNFPGVKKEDIKAKLTNGVLEITVNKTEEEKKELEKVEIE